MKNLQSVVEVSSERWKLAQQEELKIWQNEPNDNEDWNSWWASKFSNYSFLENKKIESIYEVGCGPYAKNIELVMKFVGKPERILLEDPLLSQYCTMGKSVNRFLNSNNKLFSLPMEDFKLTQVGEKPVDLVICNNVLDHVQSVKKCFEHIKDALKTDGILILGQDLTSEDDVLNHLGLEDPCHPIHVDENSIMEIVKNDYEIIIKKVLSREEGRNPEHHYATLILAAKKITS